MCDKAEWTIARKATEVAQAEWDLIAAIETERGAHPNVIAKTREILVKRGDSAALDIFDQVTTRKPDMEKARALVESAVE